MDTLLKNHRELKEKHPEALILYRSADSYKSICEDAKKCADVLGIDITAMTADRISEKVSMTEFPYHKLDIYLPMLIRAGHRVAICDMEDITPKDAVK